MTDRTPSPRLAAPAGAVLVTAASGTLGRAVVAALEAAGETVVAAMRDPRARLAEGARRASGTPAGQQPTRQGAARPGSKPPRAPNQKPDRPAPARPAGKPAAKPAARPVGLPAAAARDAIGEPDAGASVRAFDFADRGTWTRALAGVDRVVLTVPPAVTDMGRTVIPFIDQAMEQAGVRQIVFLSAPHDRFDTRSPQHLVELYLKRTRTPYTILRPSLTMQALTTRYRDDIRLRGELVLPAAGGTAAFVDADDVGRAVAAVLRDPGQLGRTHTLAGDQAVGFAQVAELLTAALDRPIRYTAVSEADFRRLAEQRGESPAEVAAQAAAYRLMRRRLPGLPSRSIRRLTGRPATSLPEFVEQNRQSWL
jgi:uncharacterized protein YbjT (DUF2867 family)